LAATFPTGIPALTQTNRCGYTYPVGMPRMIHSYNRLRVTIQTVRVPSTRNAGAIPLKR